MWWTPWYGVLLLKWALSDKPLSHRICSILNPVQIMSLCTNQVSVFRSFFPHNFFCVSSESAGFLLYCYWSHICANIGASVYVSHKTCSLSPKERHEQRSKLPYDIPLNTRLVRSKDPYNWLLPIPYRQIITTVCVTAHIPSFFTRKTKQRDQRV